MKRINKSLYFSFIGIIYLLAGIIIIAYYKKPYIIEHFKNSNKNKIPLHIHQIWIGSAISNKMNKCVEQLKKNNPEFKHHLYDDKKSRAFIRNHFEKNVLCAYDRLIPLAYKADLLRYCIMYINGGIYIDIKFQLKNGFKLIDYTDKEYYTKEGPYGDGNVYFITNGFIISQPNNPLWIKCIYKIIENVNNQWFGSTFISPTGPELVYSLFDKSKFDNIIFKYTEPNNDGKGIIINEKTKLVVMEHYKEYRDDQRKYSKVPYWKDLWKARKIYKKGSKCT